MDKNITNNYYLNGAVMLFFVCPFIKCFKKSGIAERGHCFAFQHTISSDMPAIWQGCACECTFQTYFT